MQKINSILRKYELKPYRYTKNGKVTFVDTDIGRFVVKKEYQNKDIFKYLKTRSFNYYPELISDDDDYQIMRYIEDIDIPLEQKMIDMIDLVSLLHNKTTHYKEVDEDDYKKIYEDILNNIDYLYSYYTDLITLIESHVFMSPSEYLLARNISKVYSALNFTRNELENWLILVKEKRKQRLVVLHNNLSLDHFIRSDNAYLISWDKSKIDIPIFDLYKLYKRHGLDFDFSELFKRYESNYKLLDDERKLFFILIALPEKIEFNDTEYNMCKLISKQMDMLYKTENFISPYYSKQTKEN